MARAVASDLSGCRDDPVVTRQRAIDSSSVELQLQEEEGMDGTHGLETVGVISIGK